MSLFMLFLILSALFWGTLIYKTWQLDDQKKVEISGQVEEVIQQGAQRLQSIGLPTSSSTTVDAELAERFRAWSSEPGYASDELYHWMKNLSDDHFLVITEFVAQFCDDMGFSLQHVIDGSYAEKQLDNTLEQIVVHIARSMQLVFEVREELIAYEAEQPQQPEIAEQIQQIMSSGMASVNDVFSSVGQVAREKVPVSRVPESTSN